MQSSSFRVILLLCIVPWGLFRSLFFALGPFRILFLTVFAAVYFLGGIGQIEDMRQFLLYGRDAAGIVAVDHILDLLWQYQIFFVHDFPVLDDIDGDVVVNISQHIQVQHIYVAFHFQDILFAHLIAAGVFDNGHGAVQLVQSQVIIERKAFSGLDVVQHEAFFDFSDI